MKKLRIPCFIAIIVLVISIISYTNIQRKLTITLINMSETTLKYEQIQPLYGTVKVSGNCDTDVVFTDVETGETYTIGYITSGVSEKIKLQKGRWYTVEGAGDITVTAVKVRINANYSLGDSTEK